MKQLNEKQKLVLFFTIGLLLGKVVVIGGVGILVALIVMGWNELWK